MVPIIVAIYEAAHTDGYKSIGMNKFFNTKELAELYSSQYHGSYSASPIERSAITLDRENFYLLKSSNPIILSDSNIVDISKLKINTMNKLSTAEQRLLGLIK